MIGGKYIVRKYKAKINIKKAASVRTLIAVFPQLQNSIIASIRGGGGDDKKMLFIAPQLTQNTPRLDVANVSNGSKAQVKSADDRR